MSRTTVIELVIVGWLLIDAYRHRERDARRGAVVFWEQWKGAGVKDRIHRQGRCCASCTCTYRERENARVSMKDVTRGEAIVLLGMVVAGLILLAVAVWFM